MHDLQDMIPHHTERKGRSFFDWMKSISSSETQGTAEVVGSTEKLEASSQ